MKNLLLALVATTGLLLVGCDKDAEKAKQKLKDENAKENARIERMNNNPNPSDILDKELNEMNNVWSKKKK